MKATLKSLRETTANPAVSIFVTTHREHPANQQDHIALKNQLKVAEDRITNEYDKQTATVILENIAEKTRDWNHNYNLDTLAIFASTEDAQVIRFPFDTEERVIVGNHFATRDLVRDMASAVHYYAVVITREHARLIEATNGLVVIEFDKNDNEQHHMEHIPFPIENTTLHTSSGAARSNASNEDNYLKEFLNRVDKSVQELWGEHKMPLVIVGDRRNISFYQEVCDRPENIIATVDNVTDLESGSAQHIIHGVQDAIEEYRHTLYQQALASIDVARGSDLVRTDLQDIYQAAFQGAGDTLYVHQGYRQAAKIDPKAQTLQVVEAADAQDVSDDAVGEIIELVMHNGGNVVFLPEETMGDSQPIALITRY